MKITSVNSIIKKGYLLKQVSTNIKTRIKNNDIKNLFSLSKLSTSENMLPVVAAPMLAYMAIDWGKLTKESIKAYQPYTNNVNSVKKQFTERKLPFDEAYIDERTGYASIKGQSVLDKFDQSVKELNKVGIKDNYEKYIDLHTGEKNYNGSYLVNHAKENTAFKGAPQEDLANQSSEVDAYTAPTIDTTPEDIDIDSINSDMCPELEAIYNAPPVDTPEGLVGSIFEDLPEGVDIDMSLWNTLKNMANGIVDDGDWLL